jgi:Lipocalin-like domain
MKVLAILLFCTTTLTLAQKSVKNQLIGTWRLVSIEATMRDGTVTPDPKFGPHPRGYLMYEPDGHMCAEIMKPDRTWADPKNPTEKEKLEAFDGFIAYCGTYDLNATQTTVTHHPDVAWTPPYVGTTQPRPFHLEGDRLIITPATENPNITKYVLTWERANK